MRRARVNRAEPRTVRSQRGAPPLCFYRLDVEAELHHVTAYINVSEEATFYEERSPSTAQFPWLPFPVLPRRFPTIQDTFH